MFISYSEHDVLETPINQKFDSCEGYGATLFVRQRDGGVLFLSLNRKFAEVRCNLTGKKIRRSKWDEQTKIEARDLLSKHHVSKTGWYVMGFIIFACFAGIAFTILSSINTSNKINDLFTNQTDQKKKELISNLAPNDLLKSFLYVYKVKEINGQHVYLYRSNVRPEVSGIFNPIDEALYPKSSFIEDSIIEVNHKYFINSGGISAHVDQDFGGETIYHILNR